MANFSDGVIRPTINGGQEIHYFLRDHLGSVSAIVDENGEASERNDYYPFGSHRAMAGSGATSNRFRYNGKELQTVGDLNYLDYGSRMYDSELGRWFNTDPLAEKYYSQSSYNYCANNPVLFVDPDGRDVSRNGDGNIVITGDDLYRYWGNLLLVVSGKTPWDNFCEALEMAADSDNHRFLNLGETTDIVGLSFKPLFGERKEDFSGFWGTLEYLLTGGHIDGIQYNYNGNPIRYSPIMGDGPTPSSKGKYLKGLGQVGKDFHKATKGGKSIKRTILDIVGKKNFEKLVGGNPDIKKGKDGMIFLQGVGKSKGKIYPTNLKYIDFFE